MNPQDMTNDQLIRELEASDPAATPFNSLSTVSTRMRFKQCLREVTTRLQELGQPTKEAR